MGKILIYPYSDKYEWVLGREELFKDFNTVVAILPKDWKVSIDVDQRVKREDAFINELENSECLWILSSWLEIDFKEDIMSKVRIAVEFGKKIFCTRNLTCNEETLLREVVPQNLWIERNNNICFKNYEFEVFDVDVPIVDVLSISEELSSVEQLMAIKHSFTIKGYKVALFSDAKEVDIFNDCYWLSMLCDQNGQTISRKKRIVSANHFIKHIEIEQNYDLFIIGIQGGTVTLSRKIIDDFGLNAYSISKAVRPDCVMLNIFYGDYEQEDLENVVIDTEGIIGCGVDYINIENKAVNLDDSEEKHHVCTLNVDASLIREKIDKISNLSLYCLSYQGEVERLTDDIINQLSNYSEIIRM